MHHYAVSSTAGQGYDVTVEFDILNPLAMTGAYFNPVEVAAHVLRSAPFSWTCEITVVHAMRIRRACAPADEYIALVFSTLDVEGVLVTWQVVAL